MNINPGPKQFIAKRRKRPLLVKFFLFAMYNVETIIPADISPNIREVLAALSPS